jgi:hypothetical protein
MDQLGKALWVAYIEVMAARVLPGGLRQVPMYIVALAGCMRRDDLLIKTLTQHWRTGTANRQRNDPGGGGTGNAQTRLILELRRMAPVRA